MLLKQNIHAHPLLCLADINFDDLTNVIDYIYHGEVQIYQENLDRFLLVAQRLMLDGLLKTRESQDEAVKHIYEKEDTQSFSMEVSDAKMTYEKRVVDLQRNETVSIPEDSSIDDVKKIVLEYLEKDENGLGLTVAGYICEKGTHYKYNLCFSITKQH